MLVESVRRRALPRDVVANRDRGIDSLSMPTYNLSIADPVLRKTL